MGKSQILWSHLRYLLEWKPRSKLLQGDEKCFIKCYVSSSMIGQIRYNYRTILKVQKTVRYSGCYLCIVSREILLFVIRSASESGPDTLRRFLVSSILMDEKFLLNLMVHYAAFGLAVYPGRNHKKMDMISAGIHKKWLEAVLLFQKVLTINLKRWAGG